jgi:hypothetical protein
MFGPKMEEDGSWRKVHNDELHNLYSSPNIVKMIKSRRMRLAGHEAGLGKEEVFTGFWLGGPKVRDHMEALGVGEISIREIGFDASNWMWLAQERFQCWAFVNTVIKFRVP